MYAVNLGDLMTLKQIDPVGMVLFPPDIFSTETVEAERHRMDGSAQVLACDDERSAAIVAVLRTKYHRNQIRMYRSETGKIWKRV